MLASLNAIARVTPLGRRAAGPLKSRQEIRRILVMEPKNIGDVVLTLPFLTRLREIFPQARTTMLANPFARTLLDGTGLVDEFIDASLGWTEEATRYNPLAYNWRELWRLRRELPDLQFDLAFKCCMHIREHLVIGLTGADRRIAYAFGTGDHVLTDAIPVDNPDRPKSVDWLGLLQPFGGNGSIATPRLRVSPTERQWAAEFLRANGVPANDKVIGVHPGASIPQKRWPLEHFREVVQALSGRNHVRVVVFIDPQGYGAPLAEIGGVISAKVGLRELMALIERCDLLVCNDSGPMHIAGALGVPTVAVFGSGINLWWAPLGDGHRLISHDQVDNSKSFKPYDVASIPASRVLAEIDAALSDV